MTDTEDRSPLDKLDVQQKTIRDHTLNLHVIGEQLSQIESWFWGHLADVREAARQQIGGPLPDDVTAAVEPDQEQAAPVDWQAIARQRERELKKVGEARHRAETAVAELAQAIRLTREYVGEELLPPIEGWSWYDALRRHAPHELPDAAPAEAANGPQASQETPAGGEGRRDAPRAAQADTEPLRRYRAWLANEHARAVGADQATDCPPELRISPHNGIAAGLATALHGLDHHATRHDDGPTVREAADADRNWDVDKAGE